VLAVLPAADRSLERDGGASHRPAVSSRGATGVDQPLLAVRDLTVGFRTRSGLVRAVDGVSMDVGRREIVGLVGESGSGKSTVGLSLMRLLAPAAVVGNDSRIILDGTDILSLPPREMRAVRGKVVSMTFQDPMTYLNPVVRVGNQIVEAIREHQDVSAAEARRIALEWIANVRITEPERVYSAYPFHLSGGMRQRILIAIALSCGPSLLVADEPTTALDVTIQREILELLASIRERYGTSILFITHDLGVVSEVCDRIFVMYAGQIVEQGNVMSALSAPDHPYTQALLRSARSIDEFRPELYSLDGSVPSLIDLPPGCRFRERCPQAHARCIDVPPFFPTPSGGMSRCWLSEGLSSGGARAAVDGVAGGGQLAPATTPMQGG
jgi:oligopeptide/dipeptide ABC transporter ATP-binding protein